MVKASVEPLQWAALMGIRLPQMLALPILFQVDTALAMPDGQQWVLDCGHSDCSAVPPTRCVRHQVRPFIPKYLPPQRDPVTGQWLVPRLKSSQWAKATCQPERGTQAAGPLVADTAKAGLPA